MSNDQLENKEELLEQPENSFFRAWAEIVLKFRFLTLLLIFSITSFFVYQIITKLVVDNSVEAFISSDSDEQTALDKFRDNFGRDDVFLLAIKGDVFSIKYLQRLKLLHEELAGLDLKLPSLGKPTNIRESKRKSKQLSG